MSMCKTRPPSQRRHGHLDACPVLELVPGFAEMRFRLVPDLPPIGVERDLEIPDAHRGSGWLSVERAAERASGYGPVGTARHAASVLRRRDSVRAGVLGLVVAGEFGEFVGFGCVGSLWIGPCWSRRVGWIRRGKAPGSGFGVWRGTAEDVECRASARREEGLVQGVHDDLARRDGRGELE